LNTVILNVPAVVKSLPGIVALNCVLLTKVVTRSAPLNLTTDAETKFVPFTVIVNSASPTVLLSGEMLFVVGTGLFTVNVCAVEVPPPGVGLNTVILNVPAVVKSLSGIVAVSCVLLPTNVVRSEPLNLTFELEIKFVPVTVIVNSASPTILFAGEMLVKVGTGLSTGLTVNVCAVEVPPPGTGLNTVILNVPTVVKSLGGMVAISSVLLTKVVGRPEPLNLTTDSLIKFVPVTDMMKPASPTVLLAGKMLANVGTGLSAVLTVKV
jgi:hypothetical protein